METPIGKATRVGSGDSKGHKNLETYGFMVRFPRRDKFSMLNTSNLIRSILFLKIGLIRLLFVYFRSFHSCNEKYGTILTTKEKKDR